ncbi:MAG: hypothetical protein V4516_12330 [Pseudomonadota bacterium]
MSPLEARLDGLVVAGQTITYGALARDLGLRISELAAELEALMDADAAARRPFRAVLCCSRHLDGQPALGFFLKAMDLGRLSRDASPLEQAALVAADRAALFLAAR